MQDDNYDSNAPRDGGFNPADHKAGLCSTDDSCSALDLCVFKADGQGTLPWSREFGPN